MTGGRPLRFLGLLVCGWTGMRAFALYRDGGAAALVAPIAGAFAEEMEIAPMRTGVVRFVGAKRDRGGWIAARRSASVTPLSAIVPQTSTVAAVSAAMPAPGRLQTSVPPPQPVLPLAALPPSIARGPSRLAGSVWGIVRGGGLAQASGGQLGGSQVGARITYALDDARHIALAARVSSPLAGKGAEAAIGFDWQPTRLPVHVLAERRIAIDGGRGGTMLGVVGGFGPAPVAGAVTLEGYGQAGAIARDGIEGFVDGAVRVAHPVASAGRMRINLGIGAWGGAQRGAQRLDLGPSLGIVVPVADHAVRLTADWRQRIAGRARPDSGPALSIGTNF